MISKKIFFILLVLFLKNSGMEAPAIPLSPFARMEIDILKAKLSRLDVTSDLKRQEPYTSNPNAIVFTSDGYQSRDAEYDYILGSLPTDSVLCLSGNAGKREVVISSAAEHEIPVVVSPGAGTVTFLINQKPNEKSHYFDSRSVIKTVNLTNGSIRTLSVPDKITPLQLNKIVYDEKNECYYLAGWSMNCFGDSSYLYTVCQSGQVHEIFKEGDPYFAVESMHVQADGGLLTTHMDGKVCRWDAPKNPTERLVLADFDLGMHEGILSTASDLSANQKIFYIAYNKACNDARRTLLSHIYCHDFYTAKRKELFDPSDRGIITAVKALGNSQLVCARLHRPDIEVKTDADYRELLKGPFKSTIQLWDVDAGTPLLQFTIDDTCKALSAHDDGSVLRIGANMHRYEGQSYEKLTTKNGIKIQAIIDMIENKQKRTAPLTDADKKGFLETALDDSLGREYLVDGVPTFFTWRQIRNHEHDDPQMRRFHARLEEDTQEFEREMAQKKKLEIEKNNKNRKKI